MRYTCEDTFNVDKIKPFVIKTKIQLFFSKLSMNQGINYENIKFHHYIETNNNPQSFVSFQHL